MEFKGFDEDMLVHIKFIGPNKDFDMENPIFDCAGYIFSKDTIKKRVFTMSNAEDLEKFIKDNNCHTAPVVSGSYIEKALPVMDVSTFNKDLFTTEVPGHCFFDYDCDEMQKVVDKYRSHNKDDIQSFVDFKKHIDYLVEQNLKNIEDVMDDNKNLVFLVGQVNNKTKENHMVFGQYIRNKKDIDKEVRFRLPSMVKPDEKFPILEPNMLKGFDFKGNVRCVFGNHEFRAKDLDTMYDYLTKRIMHFESYDMQPNTIRAMRDAIDIAQKYEKENGNVISIVPRLNKKEKKDTRNISIKNDGNDRA